MADSLLVPLPTVKNSLSAGRGILEERFSQLSASGDIRSHHPLGVVSPADEEAVMNGIASVIEGIEHFTKLAQAEQGLTVKRYAEHCKDASEKMERLRDNKLVLAESRRFFERQTGRSSRTKFLEQLEAIARDANMTFFNFEASGEVPAGSPTHCLSGQTFVLDMCVGKEGLVEWAKFQRILTNARPSGEYTVPDEKEDSGLILEQWHALNSDVCNALHASDMESALKGKIAVLHRTEELNESFPEAACYDRLHKLEMDVYAAHAAKGGDEAGGEEPWTQGYGVVKRLVEGLKMLYHEDVGLDGDAVSSYALLQIDDVKTVQGETVSYDVGMCLVLSPPVAVCPAMVEIINSVRPGAKSFDLALLQSEEGVSWGDITRGQDSIEGQPMLVGGRPMLFYDGGRQSGGHLISRVPVTSADEIFTILQILRHQLTIRQLYRSCFPSTGDIDSSTADLGRPETVELTVSPESSIVMHMMPRKAGAPFGLTTIQIKVSLGGSITATLQPGEGSAVPCSDKYASEVMGTLRHIPMALGYILK